MSLPFAAGRRPDRAAVTLGAVVGILGFLVVTSVVTGQAEREKSAPRKAQLVQLIDDRRSQVDDLDAAVEALRSDVAEAQQGASLAGVRDRRAAAARELLARQAGTVALVGRGLEVSLAPSDRTPPSPEEAGAYQIQDADLQLVVNALWAAGAEAIAVNGQRLVSTSPIRAAGETITVNFRPLVPPYEIKVIGGDKRAFERSAVAQRFRQWEEDYGLGFSVKSRKKVEVPAYTGTLQLSSARPVGPALPGDR